MVGGDWALQKLGGSRSSTKRWLVRYPRGVPVAIFVLIAAITTLFVYANERGERQRAEAQLHNTADSIASALERRANTSSAYLRAGSALLATLDQVTAARFDRFVSELRLEVDYGGAEGIGWAMIVPPGKGADFNALVSGQAPGRAGLRPAVSPGQPYAVPVTFLQPDTERNRRALGYDM
jgi:CHASE1-domain containing sensor protein